MLFSLLSRLRPRLSFALCVIYTVLFCFVFIFRDPYYGAIDIITYYKYYLDRNYWNISDPFLNNVYDLLNFVSKDYLIFSFYTTLSISVPLLFILSKIDKKSSMLMLFTLSVTTFYFIIQINTYRYSLALIIIMSMFFYRGYIYYIFLILISISIHKASLIYFLAILFIKSKSSKLLDCNVSVCFSLLFYIMSLTSGLDFSFYLLQLVSNIPIFTEKAQVGIGLLSDSIFSKPSIDHKSVLIPLAVVVLHLFDRGMINQNSHVLIIRRFLVLLMMLSPLFVGSALLFDRVYLLPNILSCFLIGYAMYNYARINIFILYLMCLFLFSLVIIFIWGPRNFIGPYVSYLL
ncbi:EpsG family protein [Vibrio cholerae]|uniref:EpsG family protein n=1 Tax=Vibrio cholerae TaxID=666 RepID=UPI0034C5F177